jgi:iron complex outermembrane receptor protein
MKKLVFNLIGILSQLYCVAQQPPPVLFKAVITDSITHQPVSYAIVSLTAKNLKPLKTQADISGHVTFNDLNTGSYRLTVTNIGYKELSREITLPGSPGDTLLRIRLVPNTINLAQVTVNGRKNVIESFGGGFRFNANDISVNKTGSATDMLSQVPGVSVESNDEVRLKGNTARILINGKLINLSGQELQNYLKSIAANRISSITVNTNPSSKYDALSAGGLIDIKLKDKYEKGLYGTISSKYESLPGTWNGMNIDYTRKKFTFSAGLTYLYRKDLYLRDNYILNKGNPSNYINIQRATMPQKQEVFTPRAEITYTIDTTSFINVAASFPLFSHQFPVMLSSNNLDQSSRPLNSFQQNEAVTYKGNYYNYNLNYTKNFKRKDEQLSFGGFYTKTIFNPFDYLTRSYDFPNGEPDNSRQLIQQSNSNRNYKSSQLQADYTLPFTRNRKFAAGLKNSNSLLDNENSIDNYDPLLKQFVRDSILPNNLRYKENVAAAYLLFSQSFKKFSYNIGLRYEYTSINVRSSISDRQYKQDYGNFFPNTSLSYKLSDFESLDFSFARKIDRPAYYLLDPFVSTSDLNNYQTGNPYLKPSYINSLELQYSKQWNSSNSAIATLSYNYNKGTYIYPITTYSPVYNHIITTNTNANDLRNLSLSFIGNNKINKWWQLNSYLGLTSASIITDSIHNIYYKPKPTFSGSLRNTFSITKSTLLRLTGFYNTASYEFQAKRNGLGSVNAGAEQSLLNKRLTLNVDIYDIFKTKNYTYTVNSVYYYQRSYTSIKSRYVAVSLSYSFGKSFQKPAVKKISNERIE